MAIRRTSLFFLGGGAYFKGHGQFFYLCYETAYFTKHTQAAAIESSWDAYDLNGNTSMAVAMHELTHNRSE